MAGGDIGEAMGCLEVKFLIDFHACLSVARGCLPLFGSACRGHRSAAVVGGDFTTKIKGFNKPANFYCFSARGFDSNAGISIMRVLGQGVISSAGRASALQAEGRRFDPVITHHFTEFEVAVSYYRGPVVQLVRMPACHAGGRGFEPRPVRHIKSIKNNKLA